MVHSKSHNARQMQANRWCGSSQADAVEGDVTVGIEMGRHRGRGMQLSGNRRLGNAISDGVARDRKLPHTSKQATATVCLQFDFRIERPNYHSINQY